MRGSVHAASRPGEGSCFTVRRRACPCCNRACPRWQGEGPPAAAGGLGGCYDCRIGGRFDTAMSRPRILIIEDERALTKVLAYNLEREGYEAVGAHDGQEGLRRAQTQPTDLIILDLMLPTLSG